MPEWTDPDAVQPSLDGERVQCSFDAGDAKGYCTITSAFTSGVCGALHGSAAACMLPRKVAR